MFDIIFLDVNGTLLPAGKNPVVDETTWSEMRSILWSVRASGITVGLCSDTPVASLVRFGNELGLADFPMIAENGNVLVFRGYSKQVTPFSHAEQVRSTISNLAERHALFRLPDVVAPEFGGPVMHDKYWAFGAGRSASLSVFSGTTFIKAAAENVAAWAGHAGVELSVDASPENGFLGVHPYEHRNDGKRKALAEIAEEGRRVLMIGDSMADWSPDPGVHCAFVANATVPRTVAMRAWETSQHPHTKGVIDLLCRVLTSRKKD